jgi:hypothetical protein
VTNPQSASRERRRELHPASLQRRFGASLVDAVLGIAVLAVTFGAVFLFARRRSQSSDEEVPDAAESGGGLLRAAGLDDSTGAQAPTPRPDTHEIAARLRARPAKLGLRLVSILLALRANERRSPGYRVLDLRVADARSGGGPTRRQRITRTAIRQAWRATNRRLAPVPSSPAMPENEKMRAEVQSARRQHQDDQEALQLALMRIHRENKLEPVQISCLPLLARLPLAAAIEIPMPWSPLNQSLLDWLSGTVVVVDHG